MADFSTCTSRTCRSVTGAIVDKCPQCGARVVTSRRLRALGWVLLVLGIFLICFMGYISWRLYPELTHPGEDMADGSRFTGTAEQAAMTLNLFWLVIAFGALSTANGLWQIVTGKRNLVFAGLTLVAALMLYATAREATAALGG